MGLIYLIVGVTYGELEFTVTLSAIRKTCKEEDFFPSCRWLHLGKNFKKSMYFLGDYTSEFYNAT